MGHRPIVGVGDEHAATLDPGIRCELTVGAKVAVHRYRFPAHRSARVVIDLSCGGLAIERGRTVPLRAHVRTTGPGRAHTFADDDPALSRADPLASLA